MQADLTIGGPSAQSDHAGQQERVFLRIGSRDRRVPLGAPFVGGITWATSLDPKTSRPVEAQTAYAGLKPVIVSPEPDGAQLESDGVQSGDRQFYLPAKEGTQKLHAPTQNGNTIPAPTT
jgi:hypothetical protein